jgi:hypothetical protein
MVFIIDEVAGFAWYGLSPWATTGTQWFSAAQLPVPPQPQAGGLDISPSFPKDFTGDGVDDLFLGVLGTHFSDGQDRQVLIPGPVANLPDPIWEHASAQSWLVTDMPQLGRSVPSGDVNGDGMVDRCGLEGCDFGPIDGVRDHDFSPPLGDGTFGADLDGDGVDELYTPYNGYVERLPPLPGIAGPPAGTWNAGTVVSAMDPEQDGSDDLYAVISPFNYVKVTAADFLAGTYQPVTLPPTSFPQHIQLGDFDGDGVLELAVEGYDQVQIAEQDGTILLSIQPPPGTVDIGNFGIAMDAGDVNGNGIDDLIIGMTGEDGQAYFVFDPLDCLP